MEGIIWYRLPVQGDRLNWRWVTLAKVMSGKAPIHALHVKTEYPQEGLVEVCLVNKGEADESADVAVRLEWDGREPLAYDGVNGFKLTQTDPGSMNLGCSGLGKVRTIAPGESWKIGWLRFDSRKEVRSRVTMGS